MQVTTVSAAVRFSAEVKPKVKKGQPQSSPAWRTLEFGATATLEPGEDPVVAQAALHQQLTAQLKAAWTGVKQLAPGSEEDSNDKTG